MRTSVKFDYSSSLTPDNGPVAFELVRHEVPLKVEPGDHAQPYYALSYVWVSPEETGSILFDGISVRLRENLWRFLQSLRNQILRPSEHLERLDWLLLFDGICLVGISSW